jgi:hypothetical protein
MPSGPPGVGESIRYVRGMRQSSPNGADPQKVVELLARIVPTFRRTREAFERNAQTTIPIDMMADPAAAREAIRAKYGDRSES